MNYEEEYNKAEEKGRVRDISFNIFTFEAPGQVLIGKITGTKPFSTPEYDTEVLSYQLDTDAGPVSTVLGAAADKALAAQDIQDRIVRIEYLGKKELKGGRQVNRYNIKVV